MFFIVPAQLESLTGRVVSHRSDPALACEGGQQRDTVDQLEMHFYGIQLELYDAKFEILKHEEQLLVAQIDSLRRQMRGGFHTVGRLMRGEQLLNNLTSNKSLRKVMLRFYTIRVFKSVKTMEGKLTAAFVPQS